MSKKVRIPSHMMPLFMCNVNGRKYIYPAGTIQEVPDDVASVIENFWEMKPEPEEVMEKTDAPVVEPQEEDIPKVFFGAALPQTKDDLVMSFRYISKTEDISGYCKTKAQGSSSMDYPKKNQTVKIYKDADCAEKLEVNFKGWGKQNKFCFKANWIDHSHARNIVCAKLWGEVVASRPDYSALPEEMRNSPNHGAVDGFPVKVYADDVYQGVYTLNIPKDAWMFDMEDGKHNHVLLCAEVNNNGEAVDTAANFRALWEGDRTWDWEVEVGEKSSAVIASMNALISCVKDTDDETFKATIGRYLDVQSAIDYWIHQYVICGLDGLGKNLLMATYDGTKWICGAYDMDSTFGLHYGGGQFVSTEFRCPEDYQENRSLLWERISTLYADEITARYIHLRNTVYSYANMVTHFERFMDVIGKDLYAEDLTVYTGIPSGSTNNIQQIRNFIRDRLGYCDLKLNPPEGALYPFVDGSKHWQLETATIDLEVTNGNHVKFWSTGAIADSSWVNISTPTKNTDSYGAMNNFGSGTPQFTMRSGDEVRVVVTNSTSTGPINIYAGYYMLIDQKTGNFDQTVTLESDVPVPDFGMYAYFWGGDANSVSRYEFDIAIYVNGVQYV